MMRGCVHGCAAIGGAMVMVCAAASAGEPAATFDVREGIVASSERMTAAGAVIDQGGRFGTATFVRSRRGLLTAPVVGAVDPHAVIASYVVDHRETFRIGRDALAQARVSREGVTAHNGMTTIWRQQQIDEIDVAGCELRASVTARGELISISNTMLAAPEDGFAVSELRLGRAAAIVLAAEHVGVRLFDLPRAIGAAPDERSMQRFERAGGLLGETLTKRVYFPISQIELRAAYEVALYDANGDLWQVTVDATNGDVLRRISGTHHGGTEAATYHVFTGDSPAPLTPGPATPDGTQGTPVARSMETLVALDAVASPDGWIPDGGNTTVGNNVRAHTDVDGDNVDDLPRPVGSPARVFDFAFDDSMSPSLTRDAAVTQVFYLTNWFHDRLYGLGFTEEFGNYQTDNFGRGGVGGDAIIADVQDGFGDENARMLTLGLDGTDGRMEMFLWPDALPNGRDGAFDAQIVHHELTHGLTIRLLGDLTTPQGAGMGEGWSDFYAICLLAEPGDDFAGVHAIGGYATYEGEPGFDTNYYFGIRRYPYVNDPLRSPVTFEDIDPDQFDVDPGVPLNPAFGSAVPNSVHNMGEIWCNMLLACRTEMAATHGFAANEMMLVLLTDSLKLAPANPSFVQARDAILLADVVNNGGANACALWAGFASRGLGFSALSPQGGTVSNVIEAFDVPTGLAFSYPDGYPTRSVTPGPAPTLTVHIDSLCGDALDPGSAQLQFNLSGGGFAPIALTEMSPGMYEATLPAMACGDSALYYVEATAGAAPFTDPPDAPVSSHGLAAATSSEIRFADDAEMDLGWSFTGVADDGFWERVPPQLGGDRGDPVSDADGSGYAFLTDAVDDLFVANSDVDGGSVILTSPALDCSDAEEAFISFYSWHSNNFGANPYEDSMVVELSDDDGGSWTPVGAVSENTHRWEFNSLRIGEFVALTDQVRIRFISTDLGVGGSVVESGVDAVALTAFVCDAPHPADLDGDGTVGSGDLAILIGNWGPCPLAPAACDSDLDGDGSVGSSDLALLIGNWGM